MSYTRVFIAILLAPPLLIWFPLLLYSSPTRPTLQDDPVNDLVRTSRFSLHVHIIVHKHIHIYVHTYRLVRLLKNNKITNFFPHSTIQLMEIPAIHIILIYF